MAFSQLLTAIRATPPHWPSVLNTLRQSDASVGLSIVLGDPLSAVCDKDTAWTAAQISGAQNTANTAPADTPQLDAQFQLDAAPIFHRAAWLTLLDQINTIRAALPVPLGAITPAAALAAIRTKAGTLS